MKIKNVIRVASVSLVSAAALVATISPANAANCYTKNQDKFNYGTIHLRDDHGRTYDLGHGDTRILPYGGRQIYVPRGTEVQKDGQVIGYSGCSGTGYWQGFSWQVTTADFSVYKYNC